MNNRADGYLILAVCVATASVFATSTQMFQIIRDFDNGAAENLSFVAFGLSQASLALAMVCAVIIGRNMIAKAPIQPKAASQENPGDSDSG